MLGGVKWVRGLGGFLHVQGGEAKGTKDPSSKIGNRRNTVSRVLFPRRELTEFGGKRGEFCENLVSSHWHTKNRLRGTH